MSLLLAGSPKKTTSTVQHRNTLQGWNEVGGDNLLFGQLPIFTPAICWQELSGRPHGPDSTAVPSGLVAITSGPNHRHVFLPSEAPEIGKISKKIPM